MTNSPNKNTIQDHTAKDSHAEQMKGKSGIQRVIKAAGYSYDGFAAAYRSEAAFRQVVWMNAVLLVVLCFAPFAVLAKAILLVVSALSIIVELFNTGLEAIVDRVSCDYHPLSKVAKDVGSAAQFVTLLLQTILWLGAIIHYML